MIVLVPFFGQREKVRPLLDRWIEAKAKAAPSLTWFALTDEPLDYGATPHALVDISGFVDLTRAGQPFDRKGALVCAALLKFPEPLLVLDADAFLARDPAASLVEFEHVPIAMPIDGGAISHDRSAFLSEPFAGVRKCCAGVMFFGSADRSRVVAGYRRAWEDLAKFPRPCWSPPLEHLREQHAWSIVRQRRGGRFLPNSMNWAPHFYGESADAVVNHWFGVRKWAELTRG